MRTRADRRFLDGPFLGRDALAAGVLTRAQLRSPAYQQLFHGVHVPASVPVDHAVRARAATLVMPSGAVVTGASAAAVRGCDLTSPHDPIEVVAPESCRFGPVRGVRVVRSRVADDEAQEWEGARLATPSRAAYDLLRRERLPWAVAKGDALLRDGLLDPRGVSTVAARRRDRGVPVVREALRLLDPRAESLPESVIRTVLVLAGLAPVPQLPVPVAGGRLVRVDLGFERQRVAVEYDGAWHALRTQLERDRSRLNALQSAGWLVLTFTAADLRRDLALVVAQVRAAVTARS